MAKLFVHSPLDLESIICEVVDTTEEKCSEKKDASPCQRRSFFLSGCDSTFSERDVDAMLSIYWKTFLSPQVLVSRTIRLVTMR